MNKDDLKNTPVDTDLDDDKYEKVCTMCRRPESKAGRMIELSPQICICADCMQKSFDTMNQLDLGYGNFMNGFPGINGFQNMNRTTNTEKTSKSPNEPKGEDIDAKVSGVLDSDIIDSDDTAVDFEDTADSDKSSFFDLKGLPNISMIDLSTLQNLMPQSQRIKKRKEPRPVLDIQQVPAPHKIKKSLDEHVIGQEQAKKIIAVAVYNHYKRIYDLEQRASKQRELEKQSESQNISAEENMYVEIEKSNVLMIGPTGCGKTYLVQMLAKLLDVPLAITDATSLTEAGYIGDDIESVLSKLLAAADNDVDRAEHGIVFIDEIDKIAKKKNTNSRDVSGEAVQQGLLKLLEGSKVEVPVGANSKNAMVPMTTIDTKNILFICGGAFPDLENIIKERLNKRSSMGFEADLRDKYDHEENLIRRVVTEDLRKYGMIPEFLGRLPIVATMESLTKEMLVQILKEPKNAILKQYQRLLELDEVKLEFEQGALEAIAELAMERETGARALRAILEEYMLDIMFEIPKDDSIGAVTITEAYIRKKGGPKIMLRGQM